MTDQLKTAVLTDLLRVWLRSREERPNVIASALAYELAAIVGRYAVDQGEADEMVEWLAATMRDQIRTFGVGVEHP